MLNNDFNESPLVHLVANLQHLKGKSLGELVREARYRRKRKPATVQTIVPDFSDSEPKHTLKQFLSEHPSTAIREFSEALVKGVAK